MKDKTVGEILDVVKGKVSSYLPKVEVLPITVAIADPTKIIIGVSIQRDYPLTMIERSYGIPFGYLKIDPRRYISDPNELHGLKMSIEMHETVFQLDAMIEQFVRTGRLESRVIIALSTGIGNVLQNLRSVVYVDRTLYCVMGEKLLSATALRLSC